MPNTTGAVMPKTPLHIEMKIVAMMSRGDKYDTIISTLAEQDNFSIAISTLKNIKGRNHDALEIMRSSVIKFEEANAEQLLRRTHNMIGKRLGQAERDAMTMERLDEELAEHEITLKEYNHLRSKLKLPTLTELTTVNKEMYAQSKQGKDLDNPTSTNPEVRAKQLRDILNMSDEVALERIVFNVRPENSPPVPVQPSEPS